MQSIDFHNLDNQIIKFDSGIKEKNLLIWPLIRFEVLSKIEQTKYNKESSHAKQPKISTRNFKYLLYTFFHSPYKYKKNFDIIFYAPARGRLNNRNFNIYSDYYSKLNKKTLVIDIPFRGKYILPNKKNNYATGDFGRLKSYLLSQTKNIFFKKKNPDIEKFMVFLSQKILFENKINENLKNKLYEYYFSYNSYTSYQLKVLNKLNPKIIFVNAASYGQFNAILINISKKIGILTAEFQHGTISKGHPAYNYGESVLKSEEYKKYSPDYVLTYGDYWNEQMNIPGETVTIGAPHFYKSIGRYKHVEEKKNIILIVSQGSMTKEFVDVAKYLAEDLPNYKIVFKLHPGEVPFEERYKDIYKYKNIKIAKSGDIYRFIAECKHIVACYSTTIFEAMGFKKNIFILSNDLSRAHIPKDIGIWFKEKEKLKDLIIQNEKQDIKYNIEYYFNPNWKENYERFLNNLGFSL